MTTHAPSTADRPWLEQSSVNQRRLIPRSLFSSSGSAEICAGYDSDRSSNGAALKPLVLEAHEEIEELSGGYT